jgi:hypothetical protein
MTTNPFEPPKEVNEIPERVNNWPLALAIVSAIVIPTAILFFAALAVATWATARNHSAPVALAGLFRAR